MQSQLMTSGIKEAKCRGIPIEEFVSKWGDHGEAQDSDTYQFGNDILDRLRDLHKQATVERSHYYTAGESATPSRITRLRKQVGSRH